MKIAVVGSRQFIHVNHIVKRLLQIKDLYGNTLNNFIELISGGAEGVDKHAEDFAKANNLKIDIIKPINPNDKFSYLLRNVEIITKADYIIAFWDGKSKGTKFVIDYATVRGKELEVIMDI